MGKINVVLESYISYLNHLQEILMLFHVSYLIHKLKGKLMQEDSLNEFTNIGSLDLRSSVDSTCYLSGMRGPHAP